jgi:hypothetical protein
MTMGGRPSLCFVLRGVVTWTREGECALRRGLVGWGSGVDGGEGVHMCYAPRRVLSLLFPALLHG